MKHLALAAAVWLGVGLALPLQAPAAEGMDKAAFAEFLAKTQAAAQTAKLTDPNDQLFYTLRSESYKEEALEPLKAALTAQPASETGAYVAGRLLIPLFSSDVEVVRKALPAVNTTVSRLARYVPLQTFSKEELKAMSLPPVPDPKANAEATLKALSDFSERRQKRMEAEGKVVRTNLQSMLLEKAAWEVMLRANRGDEDERVLGAVSKAVQDKRITYKFALDAIAAQAPQMEPPRAARFYKTLEKSGRGMEMEEANFINPGAIIFGTNENTVFRMVHGFPGVDMLTAANALAGPAKLPVLSAPTYEDVAAGNLLVQLRALLATGKSITSTEAGRLTYPITKYYPNTKAAEEVRKLQSAAPPARRGG